MKRALPRFYPIVNLRNDEPAEIERVRTLARELAAAGATLVQLRAKSVGAGLFTDLAAALVKDLAASHCALIVNDRADVASAAGAAGVHLGDEDLPVAAARTLLGANAWIGYSTHSVAEIESAPPEADYLGFGPVFESPTKAGVRDARGLDLLAAACRAAGKRPVVAIGGVTLGDA